MAKVLRAPDADQDIMQVWHYIAQDNLSAADRWLDGIEEAAQKLAENPGIGRSRAKYGKGLRSIPFGNYILFYVRHSEGIELIRVNHGARDLDSIFDSPDTR